MHSDFITSFFTYSIAKSFSCKIFRVKKFKIRYLAFAISGSAGAHLGGFDHPGGGIGQLLGSGKEPFLHVVDVVVDAIGDDDRDLGVEEVMCVKRERREKRNVRVNQNYVTDDVRP